MLALVAALLCQMLIVGMAYLIGVDTVTHELLDSRDRESYAWDMMEACYGGS